MFARVDGVVRHLVIYDDCVLENPDWRAIRVRGVRAIKLFLADGTCRMMGGKRWYFRWGDTYGSVWDLVLLVGCDVELLCGRRTYDIPVRS